MFLEEKIDLKSEFYEWQGNQCIKTGSLLFCGDTLDNILDQRILNDILKLSSPTKFQNII